MCHKINELFVALYFLILSPAQKKFLSGANLERLRYASLCMHLSSTCRLYWADRDRRSLSTVYTNGSERTDLFSSACPEALTMDYNTQRVYFWDTCRRDIRYLEGGTARDLNLHTITSNERVQYDPSLVRDLAFMGKTIYVAEASNAIISANITSGEVKTIISSRDLFESIAVVHPQKQMTGNSLLIWLNFSGFLRFHHSKLSHPYTMSVTRSVITLM